MKKFFRKLYKKEDGQSLVAFALLFVVLMAAAAISIDVGTVYVQEVNLQNIADAAALAGAKDLPSNTKAINTAISLVGENGLKANANGIEKDGDKVEITVPYKGDSTKIEVICTRDVEYNFARILGFEKISVKVRAVAQKSEEGMATGPFDYALFSAEGKVYINGNKHIIKGNVYAKDSITIAGNKSTMDGKAVSAGSSINVPTGTTKITNTTVPFPTNLDELIKQQGLELANGNLTDGTTLNGIYYIDGDLRINGRIKGTAIFYASGNIIFATGIQQTNTDSVMFYTNGSFTFNGGCSDVYGILYAPNGGFTNNGGPNGDIHGRVITKYDIVDHGAKFDVTSSSHDLNGLNLVKNTSVKLVE
ncbi:MAG: pilus assembly protein TadG-related protein [Firmicutes bacterium]|nr:pilus assembly protein TadG-related protein [Bacillota bacterium]